MALDGHDAQRNGRAQRVWRMRRGCLCPRARQSLSVWDTPPPTTTTAAAAEAESGTANPHKGH